MNNNQNLSEMKIVNLTPHELIAFDSEDKEIMRLSSSGIVRLEEERERIGEINGIPLYNIKYVESKGLPEPKKNTLFFVSKVVVQANPNRDDLIVPCEFVRDGDGRIKGLNSIAHLSQEEHLEINIDEIKLILLGLNLINGMSQKATQKDFNEVGVYCKKQKLKRDLNKLISKLKDKLAPNASDLRLTPPEEKE